MSLDKEDSWIEIGPGRFLSTRTLSPGESYVYLEPEASGVSDRKQLDFAIPETMRIEGCTTTRQPDGTVKTEGLHVFKTGAVRSTDADNARYDLISPIGLRRLAETYAEGAKKYDAFNYEKGMDVPTCLNHAIRHVFLYLQGDRSEDHLAHSAWNLLTSMHSEELWPHLNRDMRRGDCLPPNVQDDSALNWGKPRA